MVCKLDSLKNKWELNLKNVIRFKNQKYKKKTEQFM